MRGHINSMMKRIWKKIRKSPDYRDSYVSAHISNTIAAQISSMREDRRWTQTELAKAAGMKQSRISNLEDPNYENIEISTLKRIASAFNVGLTVRFVPLSDLVRWAEHHTANDLNVTPIEADALEEEDEGVLQDAIGIYVISEEGFVVQTNRHRSSESVTASTTSTLRSGILAVASGQVTVTTIADEAAAAADFVGPASSHASRIASSLAARVQRGGSVSSYRSIQ